MTIAALAYQLIKYQQRDKWSHRDLLRLAHPKTDDPSLNALLQWATHGWPDVGAEPHDNPDLQMVWAAEQAKRATESKTVAGLIRQFRLPREAVPTQMLTDKDVWAALLEDMPLTAMIRNLATMTKIGVLTDFSAATGLVENALRDTERLRKSRVHPVQVLAALKTYAQGRGDRGNSTWIPVRRVMDALDSAFYATFGNIEPTGKRWLLGLDVSGSMSGTVVNGISGLSCHDAQATMAMATAAVETQWAAVAFDTSLYPLTISPRQRLDDVVKAVSKVGHGGTNCALPILGATQQNIPIDVFAIFTDSETWQGNIHPVQAIQQYRRKTGIPAKLIVVAMASNNVSIADSTDAGMLNIVGFDAAAPALMADFARR